jgi:hypothetical protein
MSFLNPIMLFGLAAVSVPIIIHLLNRRKFQKVVWAAMRFLRISVEQNQRRMRIEDMILLALRCLLLVLLALALARPAFMSRASDVFGQSKVTGVVILDNSASMAVSDGTQTRFDKARQAAEQAIDSMPAGSATAVLLVSDIVRGAIPEPTFDLNLARKIVREAPLTDRATDLFPAINQAITILQERLALRKEIYLITDGQAVGWRQLAETQQALERVKSEIKTHIVLVSEHEERNLALTELRLASGLSPVGQPLRFEVQVSNFGREDVRNVRVGLSVDTDPPSDEFTIESLPARSARSVSLFARLRTEGFHSVTARIPEDRQPADNQRAVVVRAIREVRVLLVDGEPGTDPRDSETWFLANALVPVPADQAASYFIKTTTVTAAELASARLDDFDAVVLANVPDFSDAVVTRLQQYLRRGGGLMIFPGGRVNVAFYNDLLFTRFQLLPASLGQPRGDADQDQKYFTLQEKDYQHPMVALWNDPAAGTLGSAKFYRILPLAVPVAKNPAEGGVRSATNSSSSEAGEPEAVLRYSDGTVAVAQRNWGLGRVVLFSSTADTAWNDFPVRLPFVPLIHRALGSIVQRQDEGLNMRVGTRFTRRMSAELLGKEATILKPRAEALRETRRVDLVNGSPLLQYDFIDFAGAYDVKIAEPPLSLKFAAHSDAGESSMDELTTAQIANLGTVANVVPWAPGFTLKGLVQRDRTGIEFWLPFVIGALLVAGTETFLGQLFSRSK